MAGLVFSGAAKKTGNNFKRPLFVQIIIFLLLQVHSNQQPSPLNVPRYGEADDLNQPSSSHGQQRRRTAVPRRVTFDPNPTTMHTPPRYVEAAEPIYDPPQPSYEFYIPDYSTNEFSQECMRDILFEKSPPSSLSGSKTPANIIVQLFNVINWEIVKEFDKPNVGNINFLGVMEKFRHKFLSYFSELQMLEFERKFKIVRKVSWLSRQIGIAIFNINENISINVEKYTQSVVDKFQECAMELEFMEGNFGKDFTNDFVAKFEPSMHQIYNECFGAKVPPVSTIQYIFEIVVRGCVENIHNEAMELCRMYSPEGEFKGSVNMFRSIVFHKICQMINKEK